MGMIYTAITLFSITAVMGMYLSSLVFRNKQTPKAVILVHGVVTIAGFIILSFFYPQSFPGIILFFIATCCGLILLYQDLTSRRFTKWLCIAHAVLTVMGLIFLIELV